MINQKLSILIILYEEELETIIRCLEKIRDFRIIIIDNANNRSLKNEIIKKFEIYKYFLNKKNIGFSKAANIAVKLSNTKYIMNINADCLIKEEDILKLLLANKADQNCFITTPTFYNLENQLSQN